MSELKLEGLRKEFAGTTAVRDLDLHIESGESVVLLGPSGCGKTTTLRMVAGFERPTAGAISIGSSQVAGPGGFVPPDRRDVGVVFQSYALWPHMTVADNIAFGLTVRRRRRTLPGGRATVGRRVETALEQVQLGGLGKRYPHELSGGQQQRVALARALVTEPRVLLLDEPLSNLDTRLREEMRLEVRRIQRESGVTMIYITHDRTEALALADRIVALRLGETQQIGPPEQLYRHPANRFVALALGPANFVPGTVRAAGAVPAVQLDSGQVVDAHVASGTRCSAGDRVVVCVRPPDITITPTSTPTTGSGGASAAVAEAVFLGDEVHYVVDVPGLAEQLRVVDRSTRRLERGTPVEIAVAPGAASLIDEPSAEAAGAGSPAEVPAFSLT